MTTVIVNGKPFQINCDGEMCGRCVKNKEPLCALFNVMLDRVNSGYSSQSGVKRCKKCIDAEVGNN